VSLQREDVEEQFQRVLALKRLLHVDFTQVVDPPETEGEAAFIINKIENNMPGHHILTIQRYP
jgi:hypothetical protein